METATLNTASMNKKFYDFIDILKDADVPISTDEVLSMFNAITLITANDGIIFKQTLQTTLIKDYTDIPVFEKCFSTFFLKDGKIAPNDITLMDSIRDKSSSVPDNMMDELDEKMKDFLNSIATNMLFEKTPEQLLAMFLDDQVETGSSGGMGIDIFRLKRSLIHSSYSRDRAMSDDDADLEINEMLLNMISQKQKDKKIGTSIKKREDYLVNKVIYQIKPAEIKEMKELIKRFGQKFRNRISLRKKRVKHGGIDIKKTFRRSMQYGGIPFRLYFKNRKIDRPQLVVLCDVSGSMGSYVRFMLLLTHTLQSLFSKVRTFAFISDMVEITELFMEMETERAIESIFSDNNFTYGWGSNYGYCFDKFIGEFSDSLGRKTSVLVLGDARNNTQDPGLESFIRIKDRSRNLFWLNPDKKHLWNWGDSVATLYQPYCNEMKEVNSFLDLSEFIDKLFVSGK